MRPEPNCLYASYETQVYGQIGLRTRYWEEPVFSVKDDSGQYRLHDKTFPEIARHLWRLDLPYEWENVDIEAWVLCLSMTDAKVFGPYVSDVGMADLILEKAGEFWSTIQQIKEGTLDSSSLKTINGFNPLCEYCLWNADCPKFKGNDHPELATELEELDTWKSERASLDEKIKARETIIKDWYTHTSDTKDGWIQASDYRFKTSEIPGRRTLNKESLAGELIELFHDGGMDDVDVPDLIARHEKVSAPSTRLFINKTSKQENKMGYRSDIGLTFTQKAVQTLHQKLNTLDKNSEAFSVIMDFFTYADKHFEDTDSSSEVYLWEYVKWYQEFPDVSFIENLLTELDWSDFLFVRIGDELDDIETRGSFWDTPSTSVSAGVS